MPYRGGDREQVDVEATGTTVEYYASPDSPLPRVQAVLEQLGQFPAFTQVFSGVRVVVSRPGAQLTSLEGLDERFVGEGAASCTELPPFPAGPVVFIRYNSIMAWDISFAHELLHLKYCLLDQATRDRLQAVWEDMRNPAGPSSSYYGNANEMFAYFGQWYLAGFATIVNEEVPAMHGILRDVLQEARLSGQFMTPEYVRHQVRDLKQKF